MRFIGLRIAATATALAAGIALAPSAQANYDADYYQWCLDNIGQGVGYCCAQAEGVVSNDRCVSSASAPGPVVPSVTERGPVVVVRP